MSKFGAPEQSITEWYECHIKTQILFRDMGITINIDYQWKSGDVFTFLGNTIVAMLALAVTYPLGTAYGGVFGGDDSLVFFPKGIILYDLS